MRSVSDAKAGSFSANRFFPTVRFVGIHLFSNNSGSLYTSEAYNKVSRVKASFVHLS